MSQIKAKQIENANDSPLVASVLKYWEELENNSHNDPVTPSHLTLARIYYSQGKENKERVKAQVDCLLELIGTYEGEASKGKFKDSHRVVIQWDAEPEWYIEGNATTCVDTLGLFVVFDSETHAENSTPSNKGLWLNTCFSGFFNAWQARPLQDPSCWQDSKHCQRIAKDCLESLVESEVRAQIERGAD